MSTKTCLHSSDRVCTTVVQKLCVTNAETAATSAESSSDEKGIARRPMVEREPDPVPHLDSEVVRPTLELGGGPLGCIPELPDTTRDPERAPKEKDVTRRKSQLREEGFEHVMSWSDPSALNSPERRNSRLSQPHNSPDTTVWENMVMARQREEQARRDTMDIAVHGAPLSDPSERVAVRDFGRNRRSQIRSRASSRSSTPTE
ncbi:hypothetical protein M011DRAFT_464361 [Sporormia fimetaria CBS 119925]|uniref:Uncharacterized protein n=1 Tax=Sporormia fimetaria CBS 119925 TaxID=1340428 RepID=A0A6A6VIX4_9PLEO|nr:hypothetical protein M011DRAFT_464361 [Sporormia fimetaria CBS 119925]